MIIELYLGYTTSEVRKTVLGKWSHILNELKIFNNMPDVYASYLSMNMNYTCHDLFM